MVGTLNTPPLFADTGGFGHMDGFGWGMMAMGWVFMLSIVALIVWAVIQSTSRSNSAKEKPTDSAERILADRFARGEIDNDEYRERLGELHR
jgi:putative membrane protein